MFDAAVFGVLAPAPFGMELEAPREECRVVPAERFDQAAFGMRLHHEPLAEPVDPLRVK